MEYELGDFYLRVGSVLLNSMSKNAVVLEVKFDILSLAYLSSGRIQTLRDAERLHGTDQ